MKNIVGDYSIYFGKDRGTFSLYHAPEDNSLGYYTSVRFSVDDWRSYRALYVPKGTRSPINRKTIVCFFGYLISNNLWFKYL